MAIKIKANIVDITSDTPKSTDVFFVDSNVWLWVGYTNASINSHYNQSVDYPTYINSALKVNSILYKCTLSFAELAHSIERGEWQIFKESKKHGITKKVYRHNYPEQREKVVTEVENTWNLVDAITQGKTLEVNITTNTIRTALSRMKNEELDGYDLFMVDALLSSGISQVITDDGDFGQVADITVFTANQRLIKEAGKQGKLIIRPPIDQEQS